MGRGGVSRETDDGAGLTVNKESKKVKDILTASRSQYGARRPLKAVTK
jgi:hypothetical protein